MAGLPRPLRIIAGYQSERRGGPRMSARIQHHALRQAADRRLLQQLQQGEVAAESLRFRLYAQRVHRVPSQIEEVVVHPHPIEPQDVTPDRNEHALDAGPRWRIFLRRALRRLRRGLR